jgi:hypothetical protein
MNENVSGLGSITIPKPIKLSFRRGIASLNSSGRCVAVRMHEEDLVLLNTEAERLGITRGELMRWLCVFGAAALHKENTGIHPQVTP